SGVVFSFLSVSRRPSRSTLFPTRRSSDLVAGAVITHKTNLDFVGVVHDALTTWSGGGASTTGGPCVELKGRSATPCPGGFGRQGPGERCAGPPFFWF